MLSSQYTFATPSQGLSTGHVAFLEQFYQTSDDPKASRQYADAFVRAGDLIMIGKKVTGQEGEFDVSRCLSAAGGVKYRDVSWSSRSLSPSVRHG